MKYIAFIFHHLWQIKLYKIIEKWKQTDLKLLLLKHHLYSIQHVLFTKIKRK